MALTQSTLEIEQQRTTRYASARAFFDGEQWLTRNVRGEHRLTINYARALIRKVASYTFPEPVTFEIPAPLEQPNRDTAEAERILNAITAAIGCGEQDPQLLIEASYLGDAAVKVTLNPTTRRPVVAQVDPAELKVIYDAANPTEAMHVTHRYQLPAELVPALIGVPIAMPTTPGRKLWISETWTNQRRTLHLDDQLIHDEPNPYGWQPYLVIANERPARHFWGTSDLEDLYDICRELNTRISTLQSILESSGAPIAVLENIDGSDGIAVRPGAKWELPEGSKAYLLSLLQGGGLELHINSIELLFRTLFDLAETPRTAFGDSGRTISGAALEVEIQPLVQRVRRKRQLMAGFYRQRNARILDLLERFAGIPSIEGLRESTPSWPPILPTDEDALVSNQVQLVSNQIVSRKTAAGVLQLHDADAELAQILAEAKAINAVERTGSPQTIQTEA